MILKEKEKELISKEIENLEKKSSVELVAVVTKRSSNYKVASSMIAMFLLFCISCGLVFSENISTFELVQIQVLIFFGFYLFFEKFKNSFFKLLPKSYKYQIASENANKQFYNLQFDKTKHAIMFFVSFDEKYVEIITDKNISEIIPNTHWKFIIDEFINDIKEEKVFEGYLKAIQACSSILIKEFPIQENDKNELPNEVIELI